MKIAVLGAGGFIGKNLMRTLMSSSNTIIALGTKARTIVTEDLKYPIYEFDISKANTDLELLSDVDVLIHLASSTTPSTSNSDILYDIDSNLIGTIKLLQACVKYNVSRFVFASSGGCIYGSPLNLPISELEITYPVSSYGILKRAIECYLEIFHANYGLDYCSLRLANPFGPFQNFSKGFGVIPTFINKIMHDETINIFGDGCNIRDYIYIDDIVSAFSIAVDSKSTGVFNIGSSQGISINELLIKIETVLGIKAKIIHTPSRSCDARSIVLDCTKARLNLDWESKISVEEGLLKTVNWIRTSTN